MAFLRTGDGRSDVFRREKPRGGVAKNLRDGANLFVTTDYLSCYTASPHHIDDERLSDLDIATHMTTVINTPGNDSGAGVGIIVGVLIVVVGVVLFFVYGLPAIRANQGESKTTNINVQIPGSASGDAAY